MLFDGVRPIRVLVSMTQCWALLSFKVQLVTIVESREHIDKHILDDDIRHISGWMASTSLCVHTIIRPIICYPRNNGHKDIVNTI